MAIYTDSRGYKYIGNQVAGFDFFTVFGTTEHDSVTGGSTTSELGTIMQDTVGTGRWGILGDSTSPAAWNKNFNNGWFAMVWTPASITTPANVDITTLNSQFNANGFTNGSYNQFVFGSMLRNNSNGTTNNNIITTNNVKVNRPSGSLTAPLSNGDEFYASASPNHLCVISRDIPGGGLSYLYFALLQGGNLANPNDRYSGYRGVSSDLLGFRADTPSVNSNQSILQGSSSYSDTLATQPNTTGDPYLTRWYPLDNGGLNAGLSSGYAPDLFLYHDDDISVGDIINTADLTGGGLYNPGNLDGSDFTYMICISGQGAGYRLLARIGQT